MDLTKFNENGNAKDEAVRIRIDNWRNETKFDTWTMYECLIEDLDLEKECSYWEEIVHYGKGDWDEEKCWGTLCMGSYECDLPIRQIDICKFLDKDPEDLTKEDIEEYARALEEGDAYEPFCVDHEEELRELAEEYFDEAEESDDKYISFNY